jgi:hypothetical protein
MELDERLETALRAPSPRGRLQRLVTELMENGMERGELLPALEAFQARLASQGRADDADLILEIIDGLTTWCNIP